MTGVNSVAAHPFPPQWAEGACQTIEDAVSLRVISPYGTSPEFVNHHLMPHEKYRKDRAPKIQKASCIFIQSRDYQKKGFDRQ